MVPCQTMTPRLPASRMETSLPRALEPRRKPPSHLCAPHPSAFKSFPTSAFWELPFFLTSPLTLILFYSLHSEMQAPLPTALHVSLLSSLHPFFPPPFVPRFRSGVSCASRRSRPHLARGFLPPLSVLRPAETGRYRAPACKHKT